MHREPLHVNYARMSAGQRHRHPTRVLVPPRVVELVGVRSTPAADELRAGTSRDDQPAAEQVRRLGSEHHVEAEQSVQRPHHDDVEVDVESAVLVEDGQPSHVRLVFGHRQRVVEHGRRALIRHRKKMGNRLAGELPPATSRRRRLGVIPEKYLARSDIALDGQQRQRFVKAQRRTRREEPDGVDDGDAVVSRRRGRRLTAEIDGVQRGRGQSFRRRLVVVVVADLQLDWTVDGDEPQRHDSNVDDEEHQQAAHHRAASHGRRQITTAVYQTTHDDDQSLNATSLRASRNAHPCANIWMYVVLENRASVIVDKWLLSPSVSTWRWQFPVAAKLLSGPWCMKSWWAANLSRRQFDYAT